MVQDIVHVLVHTSIGALVLGPARAPPLHLRLLELPRVSQFYGGNAPYNITSTDGTAVQPRRHHDDQPRCDALHPGARGLQRLGQAGAARWLPPLPGHRFATAAIAVATRVPGDLHANQYGAQYFTIAPKATVTLPRDRLRPALMLLHRQLPPGDDHRDQLEAQWLDLASSERLPSAQTPILTQEPADREPTMWCSTTTGPVVITDGPTGPTGPLDRRGSASSSLVMRTSQRRSRSPLPRVISTSRQHASCLVHRTASGRARRRHPLDRHRVG